MLNKMSISDDVDFSLLNNTSEYEIIKKLNEFEEVISKSVSNLTVNNIATYVYSLTKLFSKYYHDYKIIDNNNLELSNVRLYLVRAIGKVIKNGLNILGIDVLDKI